MGGCADSEPPWGQTAGPSSPGLTPRRTHWRRRGAAWLGLHATAANWGGGREWGRLGWHASPSKETSLSEKGKVARHLQALKKAEESAASKTAPEKSLRLLKPGTSLPDRELIRCISQLDPQSPNGLSPGSPGRAPLPSQALTSCEPSLTQGLPSTTRWLTRSCRVSGFLSFPPPPSLPPTAPAPVRVPPSGPLNSQLAS